jgi:CRP-like cAMP-binding protein
MANPLFANVAQHQTSEAWRYLRRVDVKAGTAVWQEGDPSPVLVMIESGKIEILRGTMRIDTSGAGEIVGEMSLFTGRPRSATVRAIEDTRLLVLERTGYESLRTAGSDVVANLERMVLDMQGARLRRLDNLIADKGRAVASPYAKPPPGVFERIRKMFGGKTAPATPPVVQPRELDVVQVLALSPMFSGEPASSLGVIAIQLEHKAYPPGHFLIRQGEPGEHLYIVGLGSVDVFVASPDTKDAERVLPLGNLGPGAAFGLTSLMDDRGRMASCVAKEQLDVLVLDRQRWKRYLVESSRVASTMRAAMIRAYAEQLADAGGRLFSAAAGQDISADAARLEHTGTSDSKEKST